MRAPKLTAENLRNQVDVVNEEIRLNVLNRPYGGFPWILLPPVLFDSFPNAHNGYGDFVELEPATLDDCAEFFDTYYAPANAVLTVAGYLDVDETLALVEKHFGDIPARRHPGPARRSPSRRRRRAAAGGAGRARPAARAGARATGCPTRSPTWTATSPSRCWLGAHRRRVGPAGAAAGARERDSSPTSGPAPGCWGRWTPATRTPSRSPPSTRRPSTRTACSPRSTRSWTSWPPTARPRRSWSGRWPAGRPRCTGRTTG